MIRQMVKSKIIWGFGFRVQGSGFWVQGSGFWVQRFLAQGFRGPGFRALNVEPINLTILNAFNFPTEIWNIGY